MGIYIEREKPKMCAGCYFAALDESTNMCRCRVAPVPSYKAVSDPTLLPDWCPIIEVPKEEFEVGREAVEKIKKSLDEAVMNGKAAPQNWREWSTQRFYNMDSALTRIEELAQQMQEDAKKISDIVNEGFTVKQVRLRYGGYGDESRTEDA